jgi:hypothetical protein
LQFQYGDCLQAIVDVHHNESEGLTRLELPEKLSQDFQNYKLHPSLMDGAIQSTIAVIQNENIQTVGYVPYVPFVAKTIEIYRPLEPICFAYIRIVRGTRDIDSIKKVNVTLVDEQGDVLVHINDLAFKAISIDEIKVSVGSTSSEPNLLVEKKYTEQIPELTPHYENLYFSAEWV